MSWSTLQQNIASLADKAAALFDEQTKASQDMSALARDTMTAITDATALAQRLQQQYVQQTLMMEDEAVECVCARTDSLVARFSLSR